MSEIKPNPPQVDSSLRHLLRLPASCYQARGIVVNGRRIKSLVFAVYPLYTAIRHQPRADQRLLYPGLLRLRRGRRQPISCGKSARTSPMFPSLRPVRTPSPIRILPLPNS